MAVRKYRAIATATRATLKRGRVLYARLAWHRIRLSADPRIAIWETAELMKKAGLYSMSTATTDAAAGLTKHCAAIYGRMTRRWNYEGLKEFVAEHGLAWRMYPSDIKQWRKELAAKEVVIRSVPDIEWPGSYTVVCSWQLRGPGRPTIIGRGEQ